MQEINKTSALIKPSLIARLASMKREIQWGIKIWVFAALDVLEYQEVYIHCQWDLFVYLLIMYTSCANCWIVKFNLDSICKPRTQTARCSNIQDRNTCLTSKDDHSYAGSPCGWCGRACDDGNYENNNWCEPIAWLKTTSISFYENCLKLGSQ